MRRIIKMVISLIATISLIFSVAAAEDIVCSERCIKIKQAEKAIREKYWIVPDMYTFFVREVTETDDGRITVTLRGTDQFYWVLGTYTGSSDGKSTTASWSNEGKQTYGGFDAPAWDALQLHQMVELARKENIRSKIIIGGAVVTEDYAFEIGADGYSSDAADAVKVVRTILSIA